jgi:hypothetical protein
MRFLFISALIIFNCVVCYADKIPSPPPLVDESAEENLYFKTLYDNFHALEVVSDDPLNTRSGKMGQTLIYSGTNVVKLCVYNGDWLYASLYNQNYWDDIRISGLSVRTNATAPDLIAFAPATTNLLVYGFNGNATTEQCYFAIQLPHGYKTGEPIYPHVHWTPTDANAGTVVWSLEYTWADTNEAFIAPKTITSTAVQAGGTAWVSKYSSFPAIFGPGGDGLSSMIICRLFRNPANDTYEQDAAFLEIDFHIPLDALGSRYETSN